MNTWHLVAAAFVEFVGATVQGTVGFGVNLIAAPLLLLIDPRYVPGPALLASLILGLFVAADARAHVDLKGLGWGMSGRIPGTILGAFALKTIPQEGLGLASASLLLAAVLISIAPWHVGLNVRSLTLAGVFSGFMSSTVAVGGPPMALVYRDAKGSVLRGTMSLYGAFGSIAALISLFAFGRLEAQSLMMIGPLLPGLAGGFLLSRRLSPSFDDKRVRVAVLVISLAATFATFVRELT